jgi:predicted amidohydrolase YtcJ
MAYRVSAIVGVVALAAAALSAQQARPGAPDTIFVNGKVLTVDAGSRVAQAFALAGDRFVAVGSDAEMRALAGPGTRQVDLRGRTVVPGLIDNHNHQYDVALLTMRGVDMTNLSTLADLLARLRRAAAAGKAGETVFTTTGWSVEALAEKRAPTRQELDAIATDRAIIVYATRSRVHVNSTALQALGFSRDKLTVDAVTVGKDTTGEIDGILNGSPSAVVNITSRVVPPPTLDEKQALITGIQAQQHAMGLTGIRELQIHPDVMRAYYELWRRHGLTLRSSVGLQFSAGEEDQMEQTLRAWGVGPGFGDEWLRLDGIAEYNPGEQMREPYVDRDGTDVGQLRLSEARFREAILTINRYGWRPAIHITGDRTLDLVLDAYEAADRERSIGDRRWIVEHIPFVHPDQMQRMKRLGVVVSAQFQPYASVEAMRKRVGPARTERALPLRELLDAGLVVSGGSDWPGAPDNPFINIAFYVTRRTLHGGIVGPDQRIGRLEALRVMTLNNAYLTFEEQLKGSIEAGKLADFVVLSDDLLTVPEARLASITPVATFVGGRKVFAAAAF